MIKKGRLPSKDLQDISKPANSVGKQEMIKQGQQVHTQG
jgi:hypothetical protein